MKTEAQPINGPHSFVVVSCGRKESEVEDLKPYLSLFLEVSFVIVGKDASEALEEQQRSRVLHVRREAETRLWYPEGEVGKGLH